MAIFSSLADKLQETFKKLKGKGKISEDDLNVAMREVRLALLEADVNYKVVKDFVAKVKERALGQEVMASLSPAQQVIKIVNDELTELLGGTQSKISMSSKPPTIIMLVGLQGAGKTTTAGKLANLLRKQGKRPLLVAADVYRPAAIKQLQVLGTQLNIPVFAQEGAFPVQIATSAKEHAERNANDILIIDTAGRLHINEELMQELKDIKSNVRPHEILLVVDAMTGQDAVNVAQSFNNDLGLDGVILTKLDGDTRGGAALSVKNVTGCPIKFAGMGEKLDALEPFYPDRMASRILGMGDVLSLIEKAQATFDAEQAKEMEKKLKAQGGFSLEDFLQQMQQMKKMGPLKDILGMIPGLGSAKQLKDVDIDEKEMKRIEAIIQSMTIEERRKPDIINGSRKKRIANGSGTRVQDVNSLLKQFSQAQLMMKQLTGMVQTQKQKKKKQRGIFKLPFLK